jgi:hypothetical protein
VGIKIAPRQGQGAQVVLFAGDFGRLGHGPEAVGLPPITGAVERPYDGALVVDRCGGGLGVVGYIDGGERAVLQEEAPPAADFLPVFVLRVSPLQDKPAADDVAVVVDAGHINSGCTAECG